MAMAAWLAVVLTAAAQSDSTPPQAAPSPSAETLANTNEESQQPDIPEAQEPERTVPAPILVPKPSAGPPAAQPPPVSQPAKPPERWPLMRAIQGSWLGVGLEDERTQVYGWVQGSFTASTDRVDQLPYGMNYRANQFLLQQNWLRIDRPVVTSDTREPTFGFRSDWLVPGSDWFFTQSRGIFSGQLTANHGRPVLYGFDPVEFYAEAYFPTVARGLDIKVGRFFTQFGVEVIPAPDNVLISRTYAFIVNPFTQTGILTTTKLSEAVSVQVGMVLGNDTFFGPTANLTFIGSVKWVSADQRDSLLLNVVMDKGRFDRRHNFHNPEILDVIATHKINPQMAYAFEAFYGFTNDVPDIGTANWLHLVHFLTYNFTERMSGGTRLEFFDDFQGQRTGFPGLYVAPATVVIFRPVRWLQFRQEVRFDYNTQRAPFEGKHGLFTATSDCIVRW
jgi:hypothetical protein